MNRVLIAGLGLLLVLAGLSWLGYDDSAITADNLIGLTLLYVGMWVHVLATRAWFAYTRKIAEAKHQLWQYRKAFPGIQAEWTTRKRFIKPGCLECERAVCDECGGPRVN